MTVALKNLERRMATYNLAHPAHTKTRKFPVVTQLKNGSSIGRMQPKACPDSLTFLAKEIRAGLPDTILLCPDVKAALTSTPPRLLEVKKIVDRSVRPTTTTKSGRGGSRRNPK